MLCQQTSREAARTAAELENALGTLERAMGNQFI
jgi:hypothetical protein